MILLLSYACLAIAFQPLHPNVSNRDVKGPVKDGYLQDPRTAAERALSASTTTTTLTLTDILCPGMGMPTPEVLNASAYRSSCSLEQPPAVANEHEIVSSPLDADLANSVISASCSVGLGSFCPPASKTLLRATTGGTGPQAIKPGAISTVSSAHGRIASTTMLLNSAVSGSWPIGHVASAPSLTAWGPKTPTASDTLATVAEGNAYSTVAPDNKAGKASTTSTTWHATSSTTTNDVGVTSETDSSPAQSTTTVNVGWGSIIESSFKTTIYCSFTERCGHPDISSTSLQSACEALVKDGCANPYVESEDHFGGVEFTANNRLVSCMDSAPLTAEGCQGGLRHAASYVDSQIALKGDRACGGFVNIANAKGDEAGAIIVSGTCMPDYSNIIIPA
ncbi:hypothetical protein ASPFODRAFT_52173 [Aspergillus luchuensis CBS 106.47]|uniref:Uncharacterized protein n=1 Tax=Aspergillus luchuensis (strain CBS 106.47) TaxID=1137211 RepID=A0A1M3T313_ASPLC|nr:hypothetical protein ASPFODRAFT_52173 [Aspergillus luchuensis CBS 106.47]